MKKRREIKSDRKTETRVQARQRLSEDRYEELICGSWHKIPWGRTFLLSSSPLLLWDLNAKSLVPLQFLPTIQSFHSQPSHLMDLPWNLSSLASFSFTYLIPRHLSYPSYRDFLFQTKPFGVQKHPGVSQSVQ